MKKTFFGFLLGTGLILTSTLGNAQKTFEGSIVYTIDVNGDGLPEQAKQMMAGSEMTVSMKGEKSRTDLKMGPQQTITIADAKTKITYTLLDMMGQKYKINSKADEKKPDVTVKELPETKDIAGYKCNKAEITTAASPEPVVVYYTSEIKNNGYNSQIKGIKGYPLCFELNQNGMKIAYTAKTVSKEKIEDSKFIIDTKDYKETTREELMKSMGGH
jgi:GLPGLI family protein